MSYCLMLFRPLAGTDPLQTARGLWSGPDGPADAQPELRPEERERLAKAIGTADPRLRSTYEDGIWDLRVPHGSDEAAWEVTPDSVLVYLPDDEAALDRVLPVARALARDFGLTTFDAERDRLVEPDDDDQAGLRRAVLEDVATRRAVADTNIDSIRGGTIGMLVTILVLAAIAFSLARPEYRMQVVLAVPVVVIVATILRLLLVRRRLRGR